MSTPAYLNKDLCMINTEPARVYTTTPNEVYYITDTTLYNYLSVPAPYTSPLDRPDVEVRKSI